MTNGATATGQPLSKEVVDAVIHLELPKGADTYAGYYHEGSVLHAIDTASRWLRFMPDAPMLDTPVNLTEEQQTNPANRMLAAMINGSIKQPEAPAGLPSFKTLETLGADVCMKAEGYFSAVLDQLGSNSHDPVSADVIVEDGKPILLRKFYYARTCLSLCDIAIKGIVYPSGTIMRVNFDPERVDKDDKTFKVLQSQDVTAASALRLSTFVLPTLQRYALETQASPRLDRPVADVSFDEIKQRVNDAVAPFLL